ncbi:MAG TPA: hypothetical protein VMT24_19380, partial [Aggregatilineaceae bacterium]|nr:hypothetical protein [Aggregatilineaceae bacterium]
DDSTAIVWDATSGVLLRTLAGHTDSVSSATWSPDGTRIVTASLDRTIRVWDAATGNELFVLSGHRDGVTYAAWSPDGARIVTASRDDTAKVWRIWLTTDDLRVYAQQCCLVRDLTPEERKQFDLEQ